ncbi:MAG: hypothetical protein H6608_01800 [Flavobacteriales bacterium]|nr:hypothetical protein [Bacteroidota bacterium]MCB9239840.1 hypothetical protein [Flavobacteriales bacterium]
MKEIIQIPQTKAEKLKSVLTVVVVFATLGLLIQRSQPDLSRYLIIIGTGIGLLTLFNNLILDAFIWIWYSIASILGFVASQILLTSIFYLFLFPIALLSRLTSKDPLRLRKPELSNYIERNHTYHAEDLKNIW